MEVFQYLVDLFLHLDVHLDAIIQRYGIWTYILLFAIVFCETGLVIAPFLPGDSLLFAAGALAASGSLDLWTLMLVFIVASILGDSTNYWIGRFVGPRLYNARLPFLKPEHIAYTQEYYARHGARTILLCRFIPYVRTFAPCVAGIGEMPYRQFVTYSVAGGLIWVLFFVGGGAIFGNLPFVEQNFSLVVLAIVVLSFTPAIHELISVRLRAHAAARAAARAAHLPPPGETSAD
jgi:membrane-associated protein